MIFLGTHFKIDSMTFQPFLRSSSDWIIKLSVELPIKNTKLIINNKRKHRHEIIKGNYNGIQ